MTSSVKKAFRDLVVSVAVALMAFLWAPPLGLRSGHAAPAIYVSQDEAKKPGKLSSDPLLRLLLGDAVQPTSPPADSQLPKRPKLKPGERWVALVRFANTAIDDDSVEKASTEIQGYDAAGADVIVLELATTGGGVYAGHELARTLERSKARVYCVADGGVMSMGFYVLQSCPVRLMTDRSVLMPHEAWATASSNERLTGVSAKNKLDDLKTLNEAKSTHECRRLKMTCADYKKRISYSQDWYMNWPEALRVGAVDGVVTSVEDVVKELKTSYKPHLLAAP